MNKIMTEITGNVKCNEPFEHGWHNPHFSPEIRRSCLKGKSIEMDEEARMYYTMSRWYERISGKHAPCNFHVYRNWKNELRKLVGDNWNDEQIEWMIRAIEAGTHFKKEQRNLQQILYALEKLQEAG